MIGYHADGATLIVFVVLVILVFFLLTRADAFLSAPRRAPRRRRFVRTPFRFQRPGARKAPEPVETFSPPTSPTPDLKDVGQQQLDAVMAASFKKRRLLNSSEYHVFQIIEADIAAARRGHRVFAQTSLGEVLASPNNDAFRSINSKRVDILIVDWGGWPVLAVEYQGPGHYQGTWEARDAMKKEALCKAGVGYVEIFPSDSAEQIRARVREQLGWKTAALTVGGLRAQRA
jgi:hypothetical protein